MLIATGLLIFYFVCVALTYGWILNYNAERWPVLLGKDGCARWDDVQHAFAIAAVGPIGLLGAFISHKLEDYPHMHYGLRWR